MKRRLLVLTFALAITSGGMIADAAPTFAAQKEPHCHQKDQLILIDSTNDATLGQYDRDKDGWICQSARTGRYYDA